MTATVTVVVARDLPGVGPMADWMWADFCSDVRQMVAGVSVATVLDVDYLGTWDNVAEEAHVWIAEVESQGHADWLATRIDVIRSRWSERVHMRVSLGSITEPDNEPF